ncbi:MAG TPA: type II toxin-antitoxin system VapC family toxin [Thermoplasmata archaeon]|nr:type II toxin-antitoxin system VapC family toxin [Thermoplasmata archaeon]
MDLVVDASVVVKWFIEEEDTDKALLLRDDFVAEDVQLHVPSNLPFEVLNAIRSNPDVAEGRAIQVQTALDRCGFVVHPLRDEFARRAVHAAFAGDLTIYDAAYLALSQVLDAKFVTADEALTRAGGRSAIPLRDYQVVGDS